LGFKVLKNFVVWGSLHWRQVLEFLKCNIMTRRVINRK